MLKNKVFLFSSLFLIIIISGSYINWVIITEYSYSRASAQEYTIKISNSEFISQVRKLASTDSSYYNYREPDRGGEYSNFKVVDSFPNIVKMRLYIKEVNQCFSFYIRNNYPNKIYLKSVIIGYDSSSNRNWKESSKQIYASEIAFNESTTFQNNFEKYVLDKIVSYDKNIAKGLIFWYCHFFIYWQVQFIAIAILILLFELMVLSIIKRSFDTCAIILSLFPFIISLAFVIYQTPFILKDIAFLSVFILSCIFQTASQLITNYLWVGTVFYFITIILYLRRMKAQWVTMWLCIASTVLLFLYSWLFDNGIEYGMGYCLCASSFIILLIGMYITKRIKN